MLCLVSLVKVSQAQTNSLAVGIGLEFISDNTFKLTFNEDVNVAEAANTANYSISGTAGIEGNPVAVSVDGKVVTLELPADITNAHANQSIEIRVTNITSVTGNSIDIDQAVAKYFVYHFFEGMDNAGLVAAYTSSTYLGNHGVEWSYLECRELGTAYDQGIMLRHSGVAYNKTSLINSSGIKQGIGSISFNYYKVWSNNNPRSFQLKVNDFTHIVSDIIVDGSPSANEFYEKTDLNKLGESSISIENVSKTNQNIIIDNIRWTSYAPASPVSVEVIATNEVLVEFNQLLAPNSVTAEKFALSAGAQTMDITSVEYWEGNQVKIVFDGDLAMVDDGVTVKVIVTGVQNAINGLETRNEEVSVDISKPKVLSDLEYVDFTSVKLRYSQPVDMVDALNIENYTLSGTGGATGHPSNVVLESEFVVVLTVPSTENYEDGLILVVTVSNVKDSGGITLVEAPNNAASLLVDRTAPQLLPDLEFVDMETVIAKFTEPVTISEDLATYVLGGTSGLVGQPLAINQVDEDVIELKIPNLASIFVAGNTVTVTITVATDIAGNAINTEVNQASYVMDDSAPLFVFSSVSDIMHRSATVKATVNKPGIVYWSIFEDSKETVTIEEILDEEGDVNGTEIVSFGQDQVEFVTDQLIWNTPYKLFCVALSREDALSKIVYTSFTTKGPEEAFAVEELGQYKTCLVHVKSGRIVVKLMDYEMLGKNRKISVYNVNGQMVYVADMVGDKDLVPKLTTGIYMVVITSEGKSEVSKVYIN